MKNLSRKVQQSKWYISRVKCTPLFCSNLLKKTLQQLCCLCYYSYYYCDCDYFSIYFFLVKNDKHTYYITWLVTCTGKWNNDTFWSDPKDSIAVDQLSPEVHLTPKNINFWVGFRFLFYDYYFVGRAKIRKLRLKLVCDPANFLNCFGQNTTGDREEKRCRSTLLKTSRHKIHVPTSPEGDLLRQFIDKASTKEFTWNIKSTLFIIHFFLVWKIRD